VLIEALGEPNPRYRGWAAEAIAALGPEAVIAPLEAAGWPPEAWPEASGRAGPHIRVLIALALGTKGRDGAAVLTDVLNDDDPRVRRAAAAALVLLGGESGRALELALRHPDAAVRLFATVALGRRGPEAERPLRALMADPDPDVRYMAGWALSLPI
jgi:HEAT repeat protein